MIPDFNRPQPANGHPDLSRQLSRALACDRKADSSEGASR